MLSGTNTVRKCCPSESETESLTKPPSLAISVHSSVMGTPQSIKDWLISLPPVSPVNRFPSRAISLEKKTIGICGLKPSHAFALYDLVSRCWKTSQVSLLTLTPDAFSETWPKAGMMRTGACFRRPSWEHRISGRGYSFWPTPQASDSMRARLSVESFRKVQVDGRGGRSYCGRVLAVEFGLLQTSDFTEWLMGIPTGWTDLEPLAMDKYLLWLKEPGGS